MGYGTSGTCYDTQSAALSAWCIAVEPGDNAMSCSSCIGSSCDITYLRNDNTTATVSVPVYFEECTPSTPIADAVLFAGAVFTLWVLVYAGRLIIDMFRKPEQ